MFTPVQAVYSTVHGGTCIEVPHPRITYVAISLPCILIMAGYLVVEGIPRLVTPGRRCWHNCTNHKSSFFRVMVKSPVRE